jgi:hypothetical protein
MDLKDIMYGDVDLVHLAHDADHWWDLVNEVLNPQI